MRWLARSISHERRHGERHNAPKLVAYYWTGANSTPRTVCDISSGGIYIVTEERWHPGTLLMVTLQKSVEDADARSPRSVCVQSKVVRSGSDGVGFAFVFPTAAHSRKPHALNQGADRTAFMEFCRPFLSTKGSASPSERQLCFRADS
jgi:hypothetical protein